MPHDSRYERFQLALIEARQKSNLTQQEVAFRIGKPQSYVSKYESGERRLDVVEFLEICNAIGIKPMSILNRLNTDGN